MERPRLSRKTGRALPSRASEKHAATPGDTGSGRCPSDASVVAESLWMGRLEGDAARQFEQHCRSCAECACISERERDVIRLIRAALAEESPELMTTCPPVIFATRWPQFTEEVESQIARNEFKAERLRVPASPDKQAKGLLTFRWFVY